MIASVARLSVVAAAATTVTVLVVGVPASAGSASITGLSPSSGPAGATVAISGSGFTGARQVSFNGLATQTFTVDSTGSDITATVPAGATTGPVIVTAADGSQTAEDPTFTVQQATQVTLARSTGVTAFPGTVTLTATVTTAAGQAASGQPAQLRRRVAGTTSWLATGVPVATSSGGTAVWTFTPRKTADYEVVTQQTSSYLGATSPTAHVAVRPRVSMWLAAVAPILTGTPVRGAVRPRASGVVVLDRYRDGAWHVARRTTLDSRSRYRFTVRFPATGHYRYRVRRPADATHLAGHSAPVRVTAVKRTLRSGMSGPDVLALQKRLARLHYDIGAVDGHYGFDTVHAVTAFEKVQGMRRDGVVGPTVWARLTSPRVPRVRHPLSGPAVEVDLTHQVVYYAVDGRIRRIMDSSTGGGYYYTGSDGTRQLAITPTGHFHVVYKVDHWVTSRLGTLYRPAYFNNSGYALHGEGLVPPYPASHGCVRITVPAMNRLYNKLYVGLSIWIYRT